MTAYRMLADGRPNGIAASEERLDDGGTFLSFSAELGAPRPVHSVVGEVFLDQRLAWRPFELEIDGRTRSVPHTDGAELEIEGVPALFGVTVRRLIAAGLVPGERRELSVLHIALDGVDRRLTARYTWTGGARFRYEVPGDRDAAWLLIRPKTGVVVSLEDTAELAS
ncbi:MAG: hypothetical protein ABI317_10270 [Gaiellales bacterium]